MSRSTPLLLLSAALLAACQEEVPPQCARVATAPAEFLQYWYFPTGSYWVYHRLGSLPLQVNTVTVINASYEVFQPHDATYGMPTCTQLYGVTMWHSNRQVFRGFSSAAGLRGLETIQTQEENGQWFVRQRSESNVYAFGFFWSYPQRPIGEPIAYTGPMLLDTLPVTVPAGSFHHSVHLHTNYFRDSARVDYLYDYHLTRGIGYTRLRYANLGTWQLASYHIAH